MLTYNKDTSGLELYDGSAFGPVGSDAGLIHIKTESFSAVSSVSVNDVFSSAFENYKIEYNIFLSTSIAQLLMRFRTGSDDTGNNYTTQSFQRGGTTSAGSRDSATSRIGIGTLLNPPVNVGTISVYSPNKNTQTATHTQANNGDGGATVALFTGINNQSTQFTGFTVFPENQTITGTIRVYGLQD
jgi:hypothetical protein